MQKKKYIYWKDDDMWLGYLEEYPDYMTQAETIEELQDNLRDIYSEFFKDPCRFTQIERWPRFTGKKLQPRPKSL